MRLIFTFAVDLALSHVCPKWRLIRSQAIIIVLTVMTVRNDAQSTKRPENDHTFVLKV